MKYSKETYQLLDEFVDYHDEMIFRGSIVAMEKSIDIYIRLRKSMANDSLENLRKEVDKDPELKALLLAEKVKNSRKRQIEDKN